MHFLCPGLTICFTQLIILDLQAFTDDEYFSVLHLSLSEFRFQHWSWTPASSFMSVEYRLELEPFL